MKKRIVLLLLAALMLCALAACGEEPEPVSTPVPTPTPEATPSPTPSAGPLAEEEAAPAIISFSYESEILDSDGIIMLTVSLPSRKCASPATTLDRVFARRIEDTLSPLLSVSAGRSRIPAACQGRLRPPQRGHEDALGRLFHL